MTIQGFFNARQDGDTNAKSMFRGVKGDTADRIISSLPEFLEAAGRNYGILRTPALVRDPFGGLDEFGNVTETVREVDNQFHLTRTSDGCVVSPHTVTKQYAPLTLMDIATEIQPWSDDGWVTPDAVFSGKNESLELLGLRMDAGGEMLANGEQWSHYIIFRNPHGSGGKAKGTIVSYRQMCSNIFASMGRGVEFTIGHRISGKMTLEQRQTEMVARVARAKAAWQTARSYIADLSNKVEVWGSASLSRQQAEMLTDKLLGIPKGAVLTDKKQVSARKRKTRDAIMGGFNMPQFGTHGSTVYDWINGVTFATSSPNADIVKRSKVQPIDRIIRTVVPTESGYKFEAKAEEIAAKFISGNL